MSHRKSGLRPIVLASLFAFCSAPAFAERPMADIISGNSKHVPSVRSNA